MFIYVKKVKKKFDLDQNADPDADPDPRAQENADPEPGAPKKRIQIRDPAANNSGSDTQLSSGKRSVSRDIIFDLVLHLYGSVLKQLAWIRICRTTKMSSGIHIGSEINQLHAR